ncbi:hypothetical protein SAMN05421858_0103 [Haladaptatus litoreus]|uniref:Roadblock/LC7 domain-containing protein n=1 Tax=Haladaptatus litoreus TaxID=553468 RepID=A0A1N6UUJ8_9EURY|nr:hypothetical protein [Haladaptatus litoreus]SIQ69325.1 hypothetical protein SAMN05421858_0103 [Haladaptatus litoreus]
MTHVSVRDVGAYCKRRAGRGLQGIIAYGSQEYEIYFLSDTVRDSFGDEQITNLVELGRDLHNTIGLAGTVAPELGTPRANVYTFSNLFVIHFTRTETEGILVAFSERSGKSLYRVIDDCLERIDA